MALRWISRAALRLPSRLRRAPGHVALPGTSSTLARSDHNQVSSPLQIRTFSSSFRKHDTKIVVRVPQMAESITEGTLNQFTKKVGDFIDADEELATIETDKIDVSVNAPLAGIIQQLFVAEGDVVNIDQEIAEIRVKEKQSTTQIEKESSKASESVGYVSPNPQDETASRTSSPALDKATSEAPEPKADVTPREEPIPKTEKPATNASSAAQPHMSWGFKPRCAEEKASLLQEQKHNPTVH
ncbi:hypothetical protein N7530_005334 [Penicillium desertorum]|uniref:Lipoyl-binding domain-containing protein n=1 Tax=Penicillium desertorum TaxID=1303715 RepID=A0A9X0BR88_9EURO|nr:hypothetical protein N7530_005334 [Penicillium desertorum]